MKEPLTKARDLISEVISMVETVKDELQEKFDEKTEQGQESEAGQALEQRIATLEEISEELEDTVSNLNDVLT